MSFQASGSTAIRGTIIATHGVGDSAASLADIATHFGDEFRVYLVDLLGHGHAPRLSDEQLAEPFAAVAAHFTQDLEQIITAAPSGLPVVLMGHSFGGAVAAYVAQHNPQLVDALVLEDPAILTAAQAQAYREDAANLAARMRKQGSDPAAAITELRPDYPAWSTAEYTGWAQAKALVDYRLLKTGVVGAAASHMDGEDILPHLTMPTLLVTGDGADVLFGSPRLNQALSSPKVEGAIIRGASHTVRRDQSEAFFTTVDAFFDRVLPHTASTPGASAFIREEYKLLTAALPPQDTWDIPTMRESARKRNQPYGFLPGISATEFTIKASDVTVRQVSRDELQRGDTTPELVFFSVHGGGYVGGKPEYDDVRHEALVQEFHPAVVVSPEYRLAPEHPYPAAVIDTVAALADTIERFPETPIITYGDSAGAGLLAQVFARLEAFAPEQAAKIRKRVLSFIAVEPCLDPAMNTASWATYAAGPAWFHRSSKISWTGYLSEHKPSFAELMPADRTLVPPTLVVVNPADPLRDEGIDWARRLIDNGVNTELHLFSGTVHGLATIPGTASWNSLLELITSFNRELA